MMLLDKKIYIIAEAGVNHNGKLSIAKKLIKAAKKAGASAIKFQSFSAENLVIKNSKKAPYQIKNTRNKDTQYKMLKKLELKTSDYYAIKNYSKKLKIDFISSVFDEESISFLIKKMKSKIIKIPSGEITNYLILKKLDLNSSFIILSTGMANLKEIADAVNTISNSKIYKFKNNKIKIINKKKLNKLKNKLIILHCVTDYPVIDKYANLKSIETLQKELKINIGYSDHTLGILAPIIAVSKGAKVIEKHITLSKKMSGPDHLASLEPDEFEEMVKNIKKFEEMVGSGKKILQKCELKNINVARKSIVAKKLINKNDKFSFENLTSKRPGNGISPMKIKELINTKSKKKYRPDQIVKI